MIVVLSGCGAGNQVDLVCRQKALCVGAALAERYETEIIVGTVISSGKLHSLVRADVEGQWIYYDLIDCRVKERDRLRMLNERIFTVDEYFDYMLHLIIDARLDWEVKRFIKIFK